MCPIKFIHVCIYVRYCRLKIPHKSEWSLFPFPHPKDKCAGPSSASSSSTALFPRLRKDSMRPACVIIHWILIVTEKNKTFMSQWKPATVVSIHHTRPVQEFGVTDSSLHWTPLWAASWKNRLEGSENMRVGFGCCGLEYWIECVYREQIYNDSVRYGRH